MNKREKEIFQAQLDNEKEVLNKLEANYKDALEEVNSKIAELMGRADADMQHVIYQVDYQRALKAQIQGILNTLQSNEFSTVSEYLTKCYDEGFLGTMYSLQSQGIPLVIPMNQEEIAAAIQHETNLSSGLYKAFDTADLQKKIASEISRGFTVGASFSEIARNVSAYAGISKNNAARIVRTEGHRITETAAHHAQQKAKDRGADVVKIWDASLDAKTRESHVKVDGEIRDVGKKFSNGLMFPGDPSGSAAEVINCRCRARTEAKWALDANQTKMLGDTSKLKPEQRKTIAKKLGISEDDLDQYSGQVVPIKAKNYADFKKQYNKLWHYEGSELQKTAEARIAGYEKGKAKVVEKTQEKKYEPAKTVNEAADFANKLGVKYAEYSKLPLETANELNKALLTLPDDVRPVFVGDSATLEKYRGGKLPRSSKNYYGVTVDTFNGIHLGFDESIGRGVVDFDTNGYMVGISSSYKTAEKITASKLKSQAAYQEKYGRKWFFNETGDTTAYHEMGHVYANAKGLPDGFERAAERWAKESGCDMLKKPSEAWAEAWGAYHTQNNDLPDYIKKFIEDASSATKNGVINKNSLIAFDDDAIMKQKVDKFTNKLQNGDISTKISPQKQSRHIKGSKEYTVYAEKMAKTGDAPAYLREDLTVNDLAAKVKDKLGTGIIEVKSDNSIQEFFDCDEVIGYYYHKAEGKFEPTKRVQVKYSLGDGNIHIIPVKEKQ